MKVLVLSHVSDYLGGAERSILDVLDIWVKKYGIQPEFILRKPLGSYVKQLEKRGWKYYALDYTYWNDSNLPKDPYRIYNSARRNTRAIQEIESIIKESNPDVVITNSVIAPWAALAAYYQRKPHVWFVREYGGLDHGREFEIGPKLSFEDVGKLSNIVVANSNTLAGYLRRFVPSNKVVTLYNPFNINNLNKLAAEKISNPFRDKKSLKLIIAAGNINSNKGHLEAVIATGRLNKEGILTEICLVGKPGSPEFMNELDDAISKYDIKGKVHFVGYQLNPLAFMRQADVGIMASRKEAFGRVTFEYLAIGTPVVGAKSGATPELVDDGVNGFLYKLGDIESMVDAIKKVVNTKNGVTALSIAAKQKAEAMMNGPNNPEAVFKVIKKSLKDGATSPEPIHYTHRWLDYPEDAARYIRLNPEMSLKTILKDRLKQKAKPYYIKARSTVAKVIGK